MYQSTQMCAFLFLIKHLHNKNKFSEVFMKLLHSGTKEVKPTIYEQDQLFSYPYIEFDGNLLNA